MNIQLDSAERYFVRELAQELGDQIREHVFRDLNEKPVLWSKEKTAQMIDMSLRYVDELIADGQIKATKSGPNGGGKVQIDVESVYAWKERKLNEKPASRTGAVTN